MNILNNYLKFGEPVVYSQIKEVYEILKKSNCNPQLKKDFEELVLYAQYVPNKNFRYEAGNIILKYYSNITAMLDPTFREIHKVLFGIIKVEDFGEERNFSENTYRIRDEKVRNLKAELMKDN